MSLFLHLAWRNLWRNARRSSITLAAIAFAVLMVALQDGLQEGTYTANIKAAIRLSSGYLQIQHPAYHNKPALRHSIAYSDELRRKVDSVDAVVAYAPRIYADGLLSFGDQSMGALIVGVDVQREPLVSDYHKKIRDGRFPAEDKPFEIVVGQTLLQNLGAKIGDSLVVLAQGFDGYLGNLFFTIVGTTKTGSEDLDRMSVFMPLAGAQELLGMWGRCSVLAIELPRLNDIPETKRALTAALSENQLAVLAWDEVLASLKQLIEFDQISSEIQMLLLVLVVAFGILNTILMSISERYQEFGIMLSIGMSNSRLVAIIALEVVMLAILGIFIGDLLALGLNSYFSVNPIELGGEMMELYEEYGFLPMLKSSVEPSIFIKASVECLVFTLLAALFPLWKVYKLEPLKGIRYT